MINAKKNKLLPPYIIGVFSISALCRGGDSLLSWGAKKKLVFFLGILIFLALPIFFSTAFAAEESSKTITVKDFRGKTLTFKKPVKRIVCLIESALTGLYMLGQEQKVVGIPRNVYDGEVFKYYAEMDRRIKLKQLPAPGNWDFVNIESVISLKPDLIIIWSNQTEAISALEERGLNVYGVFIKSKEDVYKEILDFGLITDSYVRAQRLIEHTKSEIERVKKRINKIPMAKRKRVYYMWAQGNLETSCGGSTVNDLIELAGCKNVCASIQSEHLVVNMEKVIAWNPDLILMWYNERKNPEDIVNDPQWQSIKAVKSKSVFELPSIFLCDLWTLKFQYAIKLLGKWAYPDLFADIDEKKEQDKMLLFLYNKKLKGI